MKPDIEKTRAYYRNLGPENICGCAYCQNYCARVKAAYPEVALYLDSLGVDIKKPFETMPLEPDENGYLEYCVCQYAVFGSCQEDFTHQIGDVTFGCSDCHPNTKIGANDLTTAQKSSAKVRFKSESIGDQSIEEEDTRLLFLHKAEGEEYFTIIANDYGMLSYNNTTKKVFNAKENNLILNTF